MLLGCSIIGSYEGASKPSDFFFFAKHPVLTIGNFDGQHVGHQALIASVVEMAKRRQGTPMVLTFDPHPAKVLAPGISLQFLTMKEEKLEFFERLGIAELVILEFTRQLASLSPEEFTFEVLRDRLGVRELFDWGKLCVWERTKWERSRFDQIRLSSEFSCPSNGSGSSRR